MGQQSGVLAFKGDLALRAVRGGKEGIIQGQGEEVPVRPSVFSIISKALPKPGLSSKVNEYKWTNLWNVLSGTKKIAIANAFGIPTFWGSLYLKPIFKNGEELDLGLVGLKVVTTAGVNYMVDAFQDSTEIDLFNFHGIGTGSTAEAVGDTDLVTELTTQYSTDNTRDTGTQGENGANVYQSVGTNPVDATVALREHGLFDNATVGSGTLWDRTVYSLINLDSGDSLQSTYELTVTAGG